MYFANTRYFGGANNHNNIAGNCFAAYLRRGRTVSFIDATALHNTASNGVS